MAAVDDDDEEKLVREVIAENPVQERGVRSEWDAQVGWHRKENIRGRLGDPAKKHTTHLLRTNDRAEKEMMDDDQDSGNAALHLVAFLGIIVAFATAWNMLRIFKKKKHRSV